MNTNGKNTEGNTPALIVFGKKGSKRPIAAWFRKCDVEVAKWVAHRQGLSIAKVESQPTRAIAKAVPEWQFHDDGPAIIPAIKQDIFDQLHAIAGEQAAFDSPLAGGNATTLNPEGLGPTNETKLYQLADQLWDELTVGRLVLAAELNRKGLPDGWSEAVILAVLPRGYTLHWRDFSEDGLIRRTRNLISLLYPTYAA